MPIEVAYPERFLEACKALRNISKQPQCQEPAFPTYGTQVMTAIINANGLYPVRNSRDSGIIEDYEKLTEEYTQDILVKNRAFRLCAIRCRR